MPPIADAADPRRPKKAVTTRPGRETWAPEGYVAYSKVCTHAGCPVGLYQQDIQRLLCPCHQSTFEVLDGARPVFGPATRSLPQLPLMVDDDGQLRAQERLRPAHRARILEPGHADVVDAPARDVARQATRRSRASPRTALNKVFPDHWSFMIGEIAMYCLVILILTGVYLTFFFVPDSRQVVYHGSYAPLHGVHMSAAYQSTLRRDASTCAPGS